MIEEGARGRGRVGVAAFDFDGTLTDRDSVAPFARLLATRAAYQRLARFSPRLALAAARRDRDQLRAIATRVVFRGLEHRQVLDAARTYATDVLVGHLLPERVELIRTHRENGHRVVVVSASYEEYLLPLRAVLGVEAVIATRLEVNDGVCTGELLGANCRGPEKVRRLEAWLHDQHLTRDQVDLSAYGDSSGDAQMLAWADHPHLVRN